MNRMSENSIYYIGSFPEPYGGATIKNQILFNALSKNLTVYRFNTSLNKNESQIIMFLKLLLFLFRNRKKTGVICIASLSLFKLSNLLFKINKNIMNNSVVFVIGGIMPKMLVDQKQKIEIYKEYKKLYVETNKMKEDLNKLGLENVDVLPNCRIRPSDRITTKPSEIGLKCIFLSRITQEKGINTILNVFNAIKHQYGITIDFYGPIDPRIKEDFEESIKKNTIISYKGIFDSVNQNVYKLLSNYDVLLFPTQHKGEGFPGILTEAKIAGIPVIASDLNYNSEIINHGIDGIILKNNTENELKKSLMFLNNDREHMGKLRKGSFLSADKYFIDDYVQLITKELSDEL
jgi:glycosyltransferase involved in cell wall biosynthesis